MKCVTEKNREYSNLRSLESERNDGYAVFHDQFRSPNSLVAATCNNLKVSFIFGVYLSFR